ncbi:hypothetical protein VNO78_10185 [Psophocarpus tetragonolobus]|uniref:Uncharacterized protein n=1 Tax=Psophocarpus tetragonolobus TaxID=3891 RepID=A0AAN9XMI1_PSOTE
MAKASSSALTPPQNPLFQSRVKRRKVFVLISQSNSCYIQEREMQCCGVFHTDTVEIQLKAKFHQER